MKVQKNQPHAQNHPSKPEMEKKEKKDLPPVPSGDTYHCIKPSFMEQMVRGSVNAVFNSHPLNSYRQIPELQKLITDFVPALKKPLMTVQKIFDQVKAMANRTLNNFFPPNDPSCQPPPS